MSLVTQCPKCDSEYEVTADQLKAHDGLVRCGHCSNVFDGLACLKDTLPTLTRKTADTTTSLSANVTPVLNQRVDVPESSSVDVPAPRLTGQPVDKPADKLADNPIDNPNDGPFIPSVDRARAALAQSSGRHEPSLTASNGAARFGGHSPQKASAFGPREPRLGLRLEAQSDAVLDEQASGTEPASAIKVMGEARLRGDDPSAAGRAIPEFLEDQDETQETTFLWWTLGSVILGLVLVVQSLVIFRNDFISTLPSLRPLLVSLCAPLSCEVSHVRQIDRIFIVGSALQQDPNAAVSGNQRAYNLRLTLQNRGAYAQPWPALMVTLTDASGTPVIKKALMPAQYLPPDLREGPFQARQEVGLDIALRVNGLSISGFELNRFFP